MTDGNGRPLVVLGFDAANPERLLAWAREGKLPTLARLLERGCWAQTAGPELISEHGVWVSLMSGVSLAQHGYYYMRQLVPGAYDLRTMSGRDVQAIAPPFWAEGSARGRPVVVVDAPDCMPRPGAPGAQIADWSVHYTPHEPAFEPPALREEIERRYGPRRTNDETVRAVRSQDEALYARLADRVRRKGELVRDVVGRFSAGLVFVVFGEGHTAGHQFRPYELAGAREADPLAVAPREIHALVDAEMGRLLEQLPAGANVVVVSSVGIRDIYPMGGLIEAFCRKLGYQAAPPPGRPSRRPMDLARRVVPEPVRVALSKNLSREARERLLADQWRGATDWSRTTAFALPSSYTSMIRVNLAGREPAGTVDPGAAYEALLAQLTEDLFALREPQSGRPLARRVVRSDQAFGPESLRLLPDLFVEWEAFPTFVTRAVHPRAEITQRVPEFYRGTDHWPSGFFAAAGPDVAARGDLGTVSVLDLAPTFLDLWGEPVPARMEGRGVPVRRPP